MSQAEGVDAEAMSAGGMSTLSRRIGIGLALLWIALQGFVWFTFADDRTIQIMGTYYVTPAMAFFLLIWFFIFSGIDTAIRRGVGVFLILSVATFFTLFRFDGFWGDMVPRFSYRFAPTPAQQLEAYRETPTVEIADVESVSEQLEPTDSDWAQFRGPLRDGICRGVTLRTDWKENPPGEVWRHPIGKGWGAFAIVGDLAFTQEQVGEQEMVSCYLASTGERVWSHSDDASFTSAMGGDGPRGTPTLANSRIYTIGATGLVNCLEPLTGELVWTADSLKDAGAENISWGMAASPLVIDDMVFVNPGGTDGKSVIAYGAETGEIQWSKGDHPASYSAIRVEELGGQQQLILFDGQGVAGLNPSTGDELWRRQWQNAPMVNVAQPIVHDGKLFISSGYTLGSLLLDVTEVSDGAPKDVWVAESRFKLKFNDGVYRDGYVYGLDEGILSCIDASTGKRMWKRGRYGYGQLLLTDNALVVQAEDGRIVIIDVSPEGMKELAEFQALNGKTWNHPVIHDNRLYARNSREAVCFELE